MPWYIDSSAALKMLLDEPESAALRNWWPAPGPWSSDLLITESYRAAERGGVPSGNVEQLLGRVELVSLSPSTFLAAGRLRPSELRSLGAIHLAAALELGADLDGIVTYDARLASASAAHGVDVLTPGRPTDWWR